MTTQIKRRRGTTTEHSTFTGAEGEITIDTTKDTVVVHDGSTAGGHPLAKESSIAGKVDSSGDTMTGDLTVPNVIVSGNVDGRDVSVDGTKLDGIEAGADVTDATNVAAAGAAMETGAAFTGNVTFGDNDKAIFGAGSDLQIYHDGQHSYIYEGGTGNLKIQAGNFRVQDTTGTKAMFYADENAEAAMAYNGATKLATTSTGIDVTGTVTADGLDISTLSGDATVYLQNAASARGMKITKNYDDFSANVFYSLHPTAKAGSLAFKGSQDSTQLFINSNGDISFYEGTGTTPKFFWDASAESLGIGTSSPARGLSIHKEGNHLQLTTTASGTAAGNGTDLKVDPSTSDLQILNYEAANTTFWTSGTERMRIDSSGNVGIGVSDPSTWSLGKALHIGTKENNLWGEADYAFHMNQNAYYNGGWKYSHTDEATQYTQADGQHIWSYAGSGSANAALSWSEAMRIDSSGTLLVGESANFIATSTTATGLALTQDGRFTLSRSGTPMNVSRLGSDGSLIDFFRQGALAGSIGVVGSDPYMSDGTIGFRLYADNSIIPVNSTGGGNNNAVDLGGNGLAWKDLYLSGGVYLGGTGSANKLDDYEEGTFTPTFVGSTGGTVTLGSAFDKYAYTKIGRIVTITGRVDVSGTPSLSGNLLLQGLPFTSGNLTDQAGYTVQYGFITIGASNTGNPIVIELQEGTTEAALRLEDWTTASGVLVNNSRIQMSITYFTT